MTAKERLAEILKKADIEIGGTRPWDIQVFDERAFVAAATGSTLKIGEAFMNKWWDCKDLATMYSKLLTSNLLREFVKFSAWKLWFKGLFMNLQSKARSFQVGEEHYDLGNDLYQATLDKRMVYTSAIWDGVGNLDAAQEKKLKRICDQLGLKSGDRVLDIGCGWGSFMKYAAENYGVSCVGLTVSKEQTALGRKMCEGLPVEFVIMDYRDYKDQDKFDHVVSVEMIEAVGAKNFRTYFSKVHGLLKPGGKFMLQSITGQDMKPNPDPWIERYIFPNGVLPSLNQLNQATRNLFVVDNMLNIGRDYDKTLMAWWNNFAAKYSELSSSNPKYNERFYRMWQFYLQSCAGLFRSDVNQDYQILYTKK